MKKLTSKQIKLLTKLANEYFDDCEYKINDETFYIEELQYEDFELIHSEFCKHDTSVDYNDDEYVEKIGDVIVAAFKEYIAKDAYPFSQMLACRSLKYVKAVMNKFNCKNKRDLINWI